MRRCSTILAVGLGILATAPAAQAAFPGANGDLAFPQGRGSIRDQSPVDLFSLSAKGATRRLAGGAGYQGAPAYAPDGKRFAYASDGVLVAAGRRLALGRPAGEPAWSADGKSLAFTSGGDVYSVAATGRGVRRLTRDGSNSSPVWAPRGARLAFVHAGSLITAHPDGSGRTVIATRVLSADWAPDGKRLVAVRRVGESAELWLLDASGRNARRLTTGGDDLAARWSPDGTRIAFVRAGDVWTIALDGTGLRRVTHAGDVGAALAWQPLR